jgi:hypothetical protein
MLKFDDLVAYGKSYLPGIDWEYLAQRNAPDSPIWHQDYFDLYMQPQITSAMVIFDTLQLSPTIDSSALLSGVEGTSRPLVQQAGDVLLAISQGQPALAVDTAISIGIYELRAAVTAGYYTALVGADLHKRVVFQKMMGVDPNVTPESYEGHVQFIQVHAQNVTRVLQAIVLLDKYGVLAPLKKNKPTSGLGITGIEVGLVVAGVVAVAVLAYFIWGIVDTSQKNSIVDQMCAEAQKNGQTDIVERCIEANANNENGAGSLPYKIFKSFMPYIAAAALVYAAVAFMPEIITSFKNARKAAKAT